MEQKRIFIHIPKTGGTTLDCAITGSQWMKKHDPFYYRHIQHDTKTSNAGDIFQKQNHPKYQGFDLYTMLRHPVDRLVSEYYFVRDRKEYFSLLKKHPKNLEEFVQNSQTRNYMLNFLVGGRIYPKKQVGQADLERVKETIDKLSIHVGIFEEYEKSLQYFSNVMNIKWPKKIAVKRVTLNRPKLAEVNENIKETIIKNNDLDMQLYNFCKARFDKLNLSAQKVTINKDKYEYIMKYTERFVLAELYLQDKSFITKNAKYFQDLNLYLHQYINFEEGRKYVLSWNQSFVKAIQELSPDLGLQNILDNGTQEQPLETTEALLKLVKSKLKTDKKLSKATLNFNIDKVVLVDYKKEKPSFFKRLFGK